MAHSSGFQRFQSPDSAAATLTLTGLGRPSHSPGYAKQGCLVRRTLRVSISIDLVDAAGTTTRVKRSRQGAVDNCAEGGPNFGFDLRPRGLGVGCSDGRWKPGRYSTTTRVTDVRSALVAQASLYREVTRRC